MKNFILKDEPLKIYVQQNWKLNYYDMFLTSSREKKIILNSTLNSNQTNIK